jgi:hypothetical protein
MPERKTAVLTSAFEIHDDSGIGMMTHFYGC